MQALPIPLKELLQRIEAKTEKTASCWLWQGCIGKAPLLNVYSNGHAYQMSVRRLIWLSWYGPLASHDLMRVSCGVKVCIAPHHLKKASLGDISREAVKNGFCMGSSNKHFSPVHSDEVARKAHQMMHSGVSQRETAKVLNLGSGTVNWIARGIRRKAATGMKSIIPAGYFASRCGPRGETQPLSKFTWQEILIVAGLRRSGYSEQAIGDNFGVSADRISKIVSGRAYGWLTDGGELCRMSNGRKHIVGANHAHAVLSKVQVLEIVKLSKTGLKPRAIATTLGVREKATEMVVYGHSWSWLTGIQPRSKLMSAEEPHPDEALVWQRWKGGQRPQPPDVTP